MTQSEMTLSSATPSVGADSPRPSTHVRARIAATLGNGKIGQVGRTVAADTRGWWLLRERPPSLRVLWRARPALARVPGQHRWLHAGWLVFHYLVAVPLVAVAYGVITVVWHPARFAVAVLVVGALIGAHLIH